MATKGVGAYFKIDSSSNTPTNVSGYCNKINATSDVNLLDATYFQPDVAAPLKIEIAGYRSRTITLSVLHTKAAYAFFSAIEGLEGLDFEYGPEGTTTGQTKIVGTCNCTSVPFPQADVQGIETFDVILKVATVSALTTY